MCLTPLMGITGMMKKKVMNRIPFFRIKGTMAPHRPQCIDSAVRSEPHAKK